MQASAQQIFRELDAKQWKPFYLILGEEPFQAAEVLQRLRAHFIRGEIRDSFQYDSFDGEGLDATLLLASLETLPGLFDGPDTLRLVVCHRFDKVSSGGLEVLAPYFKNPSPTTCFVMLAAKWDRRKSWAKDVEAGGHVVEVNEPYDRDWPKWQSYLERKVGKRVEGSAWEPLIEGAGRSLSVVWAELQKAATYCGTRDTISRQDVMAVAPSATGGDVFELIDDILCRRKSISMRRYQRLLRSGENEIKVLSLLVRQFRLVDQYQRIVKEGVTDNKTIASQVGVHPFLLSKIKGQAQHHSAKEVLVQLKRLAECDYRVKTGEGNLFEHFFVPYFT